MGNGTSIEEEEMDGMGMSTACASSGVNTMGRKSRNEKVRVEATVIIVSSCRWSTLSLLSSPVISRCLLVDVR